MGLMFFGGQVGEFYIKQNDHLKLTAMKRLIIIYLTLMLPVLGLAQAQYKVGEQSTFLVDGTSTLHDWTMKTTAIRGEGHLKVEDGKIQSIHDLNIQLQAESLKSGKNAMDKNAHEALKSEEHPTISFKFSSLRINKQMPNATSMLARGILTIAGKSRAEDIEVICKTDANGRLSCSGTKEINMRDYSVEPPSFMFGKVTTGEEITISFDLNLQPATYSTH
jgi:hypothetical protein